MKTSKRGIITLIIMSLTATVLGQSPFSFTGVNVTEEGAILLSWQSETNTYYEVQYSDQLLDPDAGIPTFWLPLYSEYPSHGTNTFIGDFGNFMTDPVVPHPRNSPARFYRIVNMGTNTGPNPTVSITSPTNGSTLSGYVTVAVSSSSDQIITERKLYVDGQEMNGSNDGTNFVINTCEWANGPHVLFATAKSQSALEGIPNTSDVNYGRAVSTYVNVTFDNLISRFYFSEPFFKPSLGQTQQVSAAFAANVNWTLQIQDTVTNTVRTITGSGISMRYDWDGTGTGGTNLAPGVYTYLISAQTNGQAFLDSGVGEESLSVRLPEEAYDTASDWYPTNKQTGDCCRKAIIFRQTATNARA